MDLLDENIPRYNNEIYNIEMIKSKISKKGRPHAILTVGSSGSGKSFTMKRYKYYQNYVIIDYDEIALQLPELIYNKKNGIYDRNFMNKNYDIIAGYIEDNVYKKAIKLGANLICHSVIVNIKRIKSLIKNGYNITILYKKDSDMIDILRRRKERLLSTHLYTKIEFIREEDIEMLKSKIEPFLLKIEDMDTWIYNENIRP